MSMQFQDDEGEIPPSEAESRNERPQRIKHPSAKMLAHLIDEKELLHVRLGSAWERIVTLMGRIECLGITRVPSILQSDLEETFGLWRDLVTKIVQVLERINAKDSELEIVSVLADTNEKENRVRAILDALEFSSPPINLRSEPKRNQSSLCSHETNLLKSPAAALSLKSNRSSQVSKLRERASSKHSHSNKSSAAGSAISSLAALHIKEAARLELQSKVAEAEADAKTADYNLHFQIEQALSGQLTEENVSQLPKQDPSSKVLVHLNSLNSQLSDEDTDKPAAPEMQVEVSAVACTELCSDSHQYRVCHPICLADVYPAKSPWLRKRLYVALDSQSDASLATPEFFRMFDFKTKMVDYTMTTCAGKKKLQGRIASGFVVSSCDQKRQFKLPDLIECSSIPWNKKQIATKEVVETHPHLR
ncbi:uncharacterized protein LOC134297742 [Anolis carolinensis]|uniref:uncharacterized protein LOC134297742 n=1 Tax=Anolis carolinensis TaxID=28377 RepID=UPI002F2B8DFE